MQKAHHYEMDLCRKSYQEHTEVHLKKEMIKLNNLVKNWLNTLAKREDDHVQQNLD